MWVFFLFQYFLFLSKINQMKKLCFLVVALIAMYGSVNAQKGFHLIAKAGANYGKIKGQAFKDGYNLGYHLGGSFEWDLSKKIGIQPEVLFSQVSSDGTTPNQEAKLNYLSIPILLRINIGKTLTLNLGPEYSILMSQENTVLGNASNAFKDGNFAAVAGIQLNLKSLRAHARYNIGMSNINDLGNADSYKSEQIQLGVGIKIF